MNWEARMREAAAIHEQGREDEAITIFEDLVDADIPGEGRHMSAVNLHLIHAKAGRVDDALLWIDRSIRYGEQEQFVFSQETKAAYLHGLQRPGEAMIIYRDLLDQLDLADEPKARIEHNLAAIQEASD